MTRSMVAAILVMMAVGISGRAPGSAQETPTLAGRWVLNRALSPSPREIGFNADWITSGAAGEDSGAASGGRGRRSSSRPTSNAGAFPARPESADDAARMRQLTAEVRTPPASLTITDAPAAITIADDKGQSRTFHPDGREELLHIGDVPLPTTTRRDAGRVVIVYAVEDGRQLRYTLSRSPSPPQLIVDVKFLERGGGDEVTRVYEPAGAPGVVPSEPAAADPSADLPLAARRSSTPAPKSGDRTPQQTFNQQPDAELKGLTTLGVVVESSSAQTAACGLTQETLESAAMKTLTDAGLMVLRNSDEDTYVYVDVITTKLPSGLCVSRYDASLYTHTTTKLSYQETPVLVQVSLLHQGGIAGGAPAAHAQAVVQGVTQYIEQFAARIRAANK
jgi:hypothetical protein